MAKNVLNTKKEDIVKSKRFLIIVHGVINKSTEKRLPKFFSNLY